MTMWNETYAVTSDLPRMQFDQLLLVLIVSALDHLSEDESNDTAYVIGGYETLGHQIACLIAQRYEVGVGTGDTVTALALDRPMPESDRKALIVAYVDEIALSAAAS